jgi:hypothetical protein
MIEFEIWIQTMEQLQYMIQLSHKTDFFTGYSTNFQYQHDIVSDDWMTDEWLTG